METIRVFWKCRTKGCKTHAVTDLNARHGKPLLTGTFEPLWGDVHDIHSWMFTSNDAERTAYRALYAANGASCSEHGPMAGKHLKGTYNPSKVCDGRCTNAKSAACDCQCGGANHGNRWAS
jgi:hypothetical protein